MNAGRPTELGTRSWAIALAAALFILVVGAALGQQASTTPTQIEKELKIKKKEMPQCFGASAVVGGAQVFKYDAVVSTD
jgi:hypothetical protein